jgi:hypothetical protein
MTLIQADAARLPFPDKVFDMVFTSPPYTDARTYGIAAQRKCQAWIDWMLTVVAECVRVTKGLVLINCAGVTRDWCYQPGLEGLLYEWWKRGGRCWRPAFWHRVGIPGSGGKHWLRADIEYVLAFATCKAAIPWADNTANGHPPKWAPGGEMSYRDSEGTRRNQWGHSGTGEVGERGADGERKPAGRPSHKIVTNGQRLPGPNRRANGVKKTGRRCARGKSGGDTIQEDAYLPPVLANPGNLVQGIRVGGGMMGAPEAHENEAPFPLKLAQWFIRGWCPPAGIVLDPFSGSGSTVHAALTLGRRAVGCDLRFSQCELGRRRCRDVQTELFA